MPAITLCHLDECILQAQSLFTRLLAKVLKDQPVSREQYVRYLSFQYHLTKYIRLDFLAASGHRDLALRRGLRDFLWRFADDEELRYLVAAKDLAALGQAPLPMCLDVEMWHAYFRSIVRDRPFIRLGAAALLENALAGVAGDSMERALRGSFLTSANTRFLLRHWREGRMPGRQILDALHDADLEHGHIQDLVEGADKAAVLYLRMVEWAFDGESLSRICDDLSPTISAIEAQRIADFKDSDLRGVRVPA